MFKPVWNHVFAIAILTLIYVGWAAIGHHVVGKYTYFFLDHEKTGWECYWVSIAGFVFISELCKILHFLCRCGHTNYFSLRLRVFSHWSSRIHDQEAM